jgi:hypothetical protein
LGACEGAGRGQRAAELRTARVFFLLPEEVGGVDRRGLT